MRMAEIGSEAIQAALLTIPTVATVVGSRCINRAYLPADYGFPALLHYAEPGGQGYGSSLNGGFLPESLNLRYVIRLVDEGESTDDIDDAADAILQAFSGELITARPGYSVNIWPLEPWPQALGVGTLMDGGISYSETGDFYTVEILRTGGA